MFQCRTLASDSLDLNSSAAMPNVAGTKKRRLHNDKNFNVATQI